MFSGIVEGMRPVVAARAGEGWHTLDIDLQDLASGVKPGDSIAIDGCCLTVETLRGSVASFHAMAETLRLTTLGGLVAGGGVNVERSLRVGDQLGGHFVTGHVDGVAVVGTVTQAPGETRMAIDLPDGLAAFVIHKGSIALDGVSLTVAGVEGARVVVALIPYTLAHTTLGSKGAGARVNVECDVVGKWVRKLLPEGVR